MLQGVPTCPLANGESLTLDATAAGTVVARVSTATGAIARVNDVEASEDGILTSRPINLSLDVHGFMRGAVPGNDGISAHRVRLTAAVVGGLRISLPMISVGEHGTFAGTFVGDRREADGHDLAIPDGVGRVSITMTRLDDRPAGIAEVFVGADTYILRTTANNRIELRDADGVAVSTPLGTASRIELGVGVLPLCGTDCAALELPDTPTGLRLGDATGNDGGSDGVVIHRVDLFDF